MSIMSVRRRKGRPRGGLKLKKESDISTPPLSPKKPDDTTSPSRRKQPAQIHDEISNQVTPKQSTSVHPTQVTPKQSTSVHPTQVTPKQSTSVTPTQVTPKQSTSVTPSQVTPQQSTSVTPSHDTPINLSVSYDYHQSFDARDLEGPVKSMEELAGLFKDSPDGLPRVRCFTLWNEEASPTLPPRKRVKSSASTPTTTGELGKLQQLATQVQDCLRKQHNDDDCLRKQHNDDDCRGKLSLDEDTSNETCGYLGNNTSEDISHIKDVDIPYMEEGHCQNFSGHQLESTRIPVGVHDRGRDHIQTSERHYGRPTVSVVDDSHFRTRDGYMARQGGSKRPQDGSHDVRPQPMRPQDGSHDVRPQSMRPQDGSHDVRPQSMRPQDGSHDVRPQPMRPQDGSHDVRPQSMRPQDGSHDVRPQPMRPQDGSECLTRNKSVGTISLQSVGHGTASLPSADSDDSDDDDGMFWSVAAEAVSTCDSGLLEEDFCDDDAFIDQLLFDGDSLITTSTLQREPQSVGIATSTVAKTTSSCHGNTVKPVSGRAHDHLNSSGLHHHGHGQLQTATRTRTPHLNIVTASGHGVHHHSVVGNAPGYSAGNALGYSAGNAPGYSGNDRKTVNQPQSHTTLFCSESEIQRKREQAKIRLSQKLRKLM